MYLTAGDKLLLTAHNILWFSSYRCCIKDIDRYLLKQLLRPFFLYTLCKVLKDLNIFLLALS